MRSAIAFLLTLTLFAGCNAERPATPIDDDALIAAARAYVAKESTGGPSKIVISGKSGDYGRLQVEAVDGQTDPATVFMKRVNGTWTGLSLGTGFPPDDLRALGIPEALWDHDAMPAGAETVVADLYKAHAADQSPFFQTDHRDRVDRYFEPALADLIWKDAVASAGEVGAIDFDPLYDAQDVEIANLVVHPAENARVIVTFENHGTKEQITYAMTQSADAWKIADIIYRDGRTLRGILTAT
jgi:hypothetical protein